MDKISIKIYLGEPERIFLLAKFRIPFPTGAQLHIQLLLFEESHYRTILFLNKISVRLCFSLLAVKRCNTQIIANKWLPSFSLNKRHCKYSFSETYIREDRHMNTPIICIIYIFVLLYRRNIFFSSRFNLLVIVN